MKEPERAKVVAGKYALERPIGQGAMGEVWVVRHVHNGRRFAMKLLRGTVLESTEMRARFEREARMAAGLVSPHVAQVTDSGVDEEGDPYTVLELLEGEDLQKRLKREGKLPAATVARMATQIGKALRVAHGAGLVHRDLKPANIFLAKQDDDEIVKVLDFGIAKSVVDEMTEYTATGAMLGTASYMSPEHVRNAKTVDHRADLWAFAVVLYRTLTGEVPFPISGIELYLALGKDPIPQHIPATSVVSGLPTAVDVFFERAFAQDIERRYPSATAMAEGFCRALGAPLPAGEPAGRTPTTVKDDVPSASGPGPAPMYGSSQAAASPSSQGAPRPASVRDAAMGREQHTLAGTLKLEDTPSADGDPPLFQSPPAAAPGAAPPNRAATVPLVGAAARAGVPRTLASTVPDVPQRAAAATAPARAITVPMVPEAPTAGAQATGARATGARTTLWLALVAAAALAIAAVTMLLRG